MVSEKKIFLGFPHYNPMGAIRCHGNQNSNLIWPETYCSLSPSLMMLQIKFGCNRPMVAEIFMFESVNGRTDACTDGRTAGHSNETVFMWLRFRILDTFVAICLCVA